VAGITRRACLQVGDRLSAGRGAIVTGGA
jgi:hypothetical protein